MVRGRSCVTELTSPSARPRRSGSNFSGWGIGFFSNFIDRRRRGLLFAETIPLAERLKFVPAHGFHDVVVQVAQTRVIVDVESARQQFVERLVELFPRLSQAAGLKVQLACFKRRPTLGLKPIGPIRCDANQRRDVFKLRIDRQWRQWLLLRRRSNLNRMDLDLVPGRIFTPRGACKHTSSD